VIMACGGGSGLTSTTGKAVGEKKTDTQNGYLFVMYDTLTLIAGLSGGDQRQITECAVIFCPRDTF
jgi:hypothetical protein